MINASPNSSGGQGYTNAIMGVFYSVTPLVLLFYAFLFLVCIWKRKAQPLRSRGVTPYVVLVCYSVMLIRSLLEGRVTLSTAMGPSPIRGTSAECVVYYMFGFAFASTAIGVKVVHILALECKIAFLHRRWSLIQQNKYGIAGEKTSRTLSWLRWLSSLKSQAIGVALVFGFFLSIMLGYMIHGLVDPSTGHCKFEGVPFKTDELFSTVLVAIVFVILTIYLIFDTFSAHRKRRYYARKICGIGENSSVGLGDFQKERQADNENSQSDPSQETTSSSADLSNLSWRFQDPFFTTVEIVLVLIGFIARMVLLSIAIHVKVPAIVQYFLVIIANTLCVVGPMVMFPCFLTIFWDYQSQKTRKGMSSQEMEMKDQPSQVAVSDNITLQAVYNDKHLLRAFRAFCKAEFNSDNIKFLEDMAAYREMNDVEQRKAKAKEMYEVYIKEDAMLSLNLSKKIRRSIEESLEQDEAPPDLFQAVDYHISMQIMPDIFSRFTRTPEFIKLKEAEKKHFSDIAQ